MYLFAVLLDQSNGCAEYYEFTSGIQRVKMLMWLCVMNWNKLDWNHKAIRLSTLAYVVMCNELE